jgi:hypothetical protein
VAWRLLKLFPQSFAGVRSDEDLAASQLDWLICQMLLDDGGTVCPDCDTVWFANFCGQCGQRLRPVPRTCPECQWPTTTAYCEQCGAVATSPTHDAIDLGTFDWDAWRAQLQPFLHGLTPQELTLLGAQ